MVAHRLCCFHQVNYSQRPNTYRHTPPSNRSSTLRGILSCGWKVKVEGKLISVWGLRSVVMREFLLPATTLDSSACWNESMSAQFRLQCRAPIILQTIGNQIQPFLLFLLPRSCSTSARLLSQRRANLQHQDTWTRGTTIGWNGKQWVWIWVPWWRNVGWYTDASTAAG